MPSINLTAKETNATRSIVQKHLELVQATLQNTRLTRERELQLIAERDSTRDLLVKFPTPKKEAPAKKATKASSK